MRRGEALECVSTGRHRARSLLSFVAPLRLYCYTCTRLAVNDAAAALLFPPPPLLPRYGCNESIQLEKLGSVFAYTRRKKMRREQVEVCLGEKK